MRKFILVCMVAFVFSGCQINGNPTIDRSSQSTSNATSSSASSSKITVFNPTTSYTKEEIIQKLNQGTIPGIDLSVGQALKGEQYDLVPLKHYYDYKTSKGKMEYDKIHAGYTVKNGQKTIEEITVVILNNPANKDNSVFGLKISDLGIQDIKGILGKENYSTSHTGDNPFTIFTYLFGEYVFEVAFWGENKGELQYMTIREKS